jgi:hypothetical protein
MNIKKDFVEIIEFLQANQNKKVSTVMDALLEMTSRKGGGGANGSTVYKDDEGNVVAIFCYYHKKWELVSQVPYGKKANTSSGLNTMCKEGVSNWTKQQRKAKQAEGELLNQLASGEVEASDLTALRADIDAQKQEVVAHSDEVHSFDTLEELQAFIAS